MALDLRELFRATFAPVTPGKTASILLKGIAANDDIGEVYEQALRLDRFFTTQTIELASAALKKSVVKSLSHATTLFGKETIRNFVFGHTLLRTQSANADEVFQDINQSKALLKRAIEAEELSTKLGNSYAGLSFCAGYVFDLLEQKFIADPKLQKYHDFFLSVWRHSLRTASLAHTFTHHESVVVKLNRLSFTAGLLHDVGKIVLLLSAPDQYEPLMKLFDEAKVSSPMDDLPQVAIEKAALGLSHPEVGSFFCTHLGFVGELETPVDFHHEFGVLKNRDPDMYILAQFINVADRLAFYLETSSQLDPTVLQKLVEPNRPVFPLNGTQVQSLALTLRSKGCLP